LLNIDGVAAYTIEFLVLWLITSAACALTLFLQRSPDEVNRCPLDAESRPVGCPKQAPAQHT